MKITSIIFLFSMLICSKSSSISCNSEVCFTCKVTFNKLTLICKVHNLHLRVLIENQFGEIQADCSPPTSEINCESFYSNGTITQDPKSNETIFMVQGKIDNHINGIWKCRHGTERDLAQVSVLYSKNYHEKIYETVISENGCITKTLLYSLATLLFSLVVCLILLSCKTNSFRKVDDLFVLIKKSYCRCITFDTSKTVTVSKRVCFMFLLVVFIGLSALISGIVDNTQECVSQWVFSAIGLVFGSSIGLLFLNTGQKEDKSHQPTFELNDKDILESVDTSDIHNPTDENEQLTQISELQDVTNNDA